MKNISIPAFIVLLLLFGACRNESKTGEPSVKTAQVTDSVLGVVVADTIIYDVDIINTNPEDPWSEHRLKRLDHELLVDQIFEMIYKGQVTAYDHFTNEKLTIRQVQDMEKAEGFGRDQVGMIQFKEAWYINPGETAMTKKVISMVLGMAAYTSSGEFKGNTALMRVELEGMNGKQ